MRTEPKTIPDALRQLRYWERLRPKTAAQARKRAQALRSLQRTLP